MFDAEREEVKCKELFERRRGLYEVWCSRRSPALFGFSVTLGEVAADGPPARELVPSRARNH